MHLDLRQATYDQFVAFVFDHYPEDEVDDKWYWKTDAEITTDPRRAVEYLTKALSSGRDLLEQFTHRQIAEGFHYLLGAGAGPEVLEQLWNADVPWPDRRRCIMAIPKLYTDVLEQEADGVGGCAYMLWDLVAYGYQCGNRDATTNPEDARVQDAMLEALRPMLNSRHPETQAGALHGLGHLCHRDTARTIREFLASDKPSNAQVRAYAASVLEGSFQ